MPRCKTRKSKIIASPGLDSISTLLCCHGGEDDEAEDKKDDEADDDDDDDDDDDEEEEEEEEVCASCRNADSICSEVQRCVPGQNSVGPRSDGVSHMGKKS